MITPQHNKGFTLFELLVATSIFAIVSSMAYTGLMQVLDARAHTQRVEKRLAELQMAFLYLGRDVQHFINRPVRNEYGDEIAALKGGELGDYRLELTRTGRRNPARAQRSLLQRVAYMVEDEKLFRVSWSVLDRAQDTEPKRTLVLDKTENLEILFLQQDGEWVSDWPPEAGPGEVIGTPRAIAVNVKLRDMGQINRIYLLPEV